MNNLLNNFGLCRKAGKLALGFDSVKQEIIDNKAQLVVLTHDVSNKTKKEMKFWTDKYNVETLDISLNMEETQQLFHKKVGVLAVLDEGFAKLIKRTAENCRETDTNNKNHQGGSTIV